MIMINVLNLHIKVATVTVLFVVDIGLLTADVSASLLKLLNMLFICGLTSYRTSLRELQTFYFCQMLCLRYVFEVISQGVYVAHIRLSVLAKGVAACCKKVEWDVRLQGHKHVSSNFSMIVVRPLKLSATNWKLFFVRKHNICFVFEVHKTQFLHLNTFQKQCACLWFKFICAHI